MRERIVNWGFVLISGLAEESLCSRTGTFDAETSVSESDDTVLFK